MKMWSAVKKAWATLDYVPDCPTCKGKGVASHPMNNMVVWWRGKEVSGCWQCAGRGKL